MNNINYLWLSSYMNITTGELNMKFYKLLKDIDLENENYIIYCSGHCKKR